MIVFKTALLVWILILWQQIEANKKISSKVFKKRVLNEGYQDVTMEETTSTNLIGCTTKCSMLPGCKAFLFEDSDKDIKECILKRQTHSVDRATPPPDSAKFLSYVRLPYDDYVPDYSKVPEGYNELDGKFVAIKKQPSIKLDLAGAEEDCNKDDAILTPIYTEEQIENVIKFLGQEVGNFKDIILWIGLSDRIKNGIWILSNGSDLADLPGTPFWAEIQTNQPSGAPGENCASNKGDHLDDKPCFAVSSWVCEYIKDDGNAPPEYEQVDDRYLQLNTGLKTYEDAEKDCQAKEGVIAIPFLKDGTEQILKYARDKSGLPSIIIWYGLDDKNKEGHWILSNGTKLVDLPLKTFKWGFLSKTSKEPNGDAIEGCIIISQDGLQDTMCNGRDTTHFACEYYGKSVGRGKPTFGEKAFCPTCETARAVDGNYDPNYGGPKHGATVLMGDPTTKAWFMIDLTDPYFIWKIKISYNSINPNPETLKDFRIRVGYYKDNYRDNALCYHFKETFPAFSTYVLPCINPPVEGRYVVLYVESNTGFILLTELDIYGYLEPPGYYD